MKQLYRFIFTTLSLIFVQVLLGSSELSAQTELVFTTNVATKGAGEYYFVVTENTRMTFEVWGGGGRGGGKTSGTGGSGGGGGGAYARKTIDLVVGDRVDIIVGAGGKSVNNSITDGGISEVKLNGDIFLKATGGKSVADNNSVGGIGGSLSDCIGDIRRSGGNGANVSGNNGGGGGSSAGPAANGANGSGSNGGVAPSNGGNGGNGYSTFLGQGNGSAGVLGGGGGGGKRTISGTQNGGNGGDGRIRIMNMCRAYWYKADMPGSELPGNGDDLTVWTDRTENENDGVSHTSADGDYTKSDKHPKWYDNIFNFNPAVKFDEGYYRANRRSVENDIAIYTVFSTEQTTSSAAWWTMPAIIGGEAKGEQNDWGFSHNAGKLFFKSTNSDILSDNPQTTNAYNHGKPVLASGFRKMGVESYIHINGKEEASKPDSDGKSLEDTPIIGIGRNPTEINSQFKGYIAEVTTLNNMCNLTDRHINDTYFAIKYGITLEHDYKRRHATDSVLYSIATYNHDIAGLGRQDYTLELHQKVSTSSNVSLGTLGRVVISTNDNFVSSNVTHPRPSIADGQYLIWGHNNEGEGWTSIKDDKIKHQNRIWKIQNTANSNGVFVSGTFLQIDLHTLDPINPNTNDIYAIIVSKSADFSSHIAYYPLTNTSGTLYSTETEINFPGGVSYFTLAKMTENYWTGSTNTVWSNPENWTAGIIPGADDDVIFATEANYGTTATNSIIITEGEKIEVRNIINEADKNIVIEAGASLKLNGYIKIADDTNPERLQIKAAANKPNGSFIVDCDAQTSEQKDVYATVEMYAKGFKGTETIWTDDIEGSPTKGETFTASYHWQHFGVPVASIKANPTFYGSFLREYDESKNATDSYYYKWIDLGNESVLTAFKGYEITQDAPTTYHIAGKLNYCDETITLTRSAPLVSGSSGNINNTHYALGQNVFGNSFTGSITIANIGFPERVEPTVYLYNTGSFTAWGNVGDFNDPTNPGTNDGTTALVAGQYTAIPQEAAPAVFDKIPSMNGFLLIHKGNDYGSYGTIDDADVEMILPYASVAANNRPQTAPREPISYMQLTLSSENSVDNLWLIAHDEATSGTDEGWDGRKFFGTPTPFIYTENSDGPMQVNTDRSIDGSLISFYPYKDTEYELTVSKYNLDYTDNWQLLDLETRVATPLSDEITTYSFTANNLGTVQKRFRIVNSDYIDWDTLELKLLNAYIEDGNRLIVTNYTDRKGVVRIFDTTGRIIMQQSMLPAINAYELHLPKGIYIVQLLTDSKKESVKLILK